MLEYAINYDYIKTVLCVYKDKPELKCNGKCHLKKQLAKAADDEKPISSDKKAGAHQETEILFFVNYEAVLFSSAFHIENQTVKSSYTNLYKFTALSTAFHPPSQLV